MSPDLNVLDLGYFTSIQGLQQKKKVFTVNQLVGNFKKYFNDLPVKTLVCIFLTLKLVVIDIISKYRDNTYVLKHHIKSQI